MKKYKILGIKLLVIVEKDKKCKTDAKKYFIYTKLFLSNR